MRNSDKPVEVIAKYKYAIAYKQGKSYYAVGRMNGKNCGRLRTKNEIWARHHAQKQSDSLERIANGG